PGHDPAVLRPAGDLPGGDAPGPGEGSLLLPLLAVDRLPGPQLLPDRLPPLAGTAAGRAHREPGRVRRRELRLPRGRSRPSAAPPRAARRPIGQSNEMTATALISGAHRLAPGSGRRHPRPRAAARAGRAARAGPADTG